MQIPLTSHCWQLLGQPIINGEKCEESLLVAFWVVPLEAVPLEAVPLEAVPLEVVPLEAVPFDVWLYLTHKPKARSVS